MAPRHDLKVILSAIGVILTEHRINMPDGPSHGFEKGRSILTNARQHVGRHYLLNMDLKNFFPSITRRMVKAALIQQSWSREVASAIAAIATVPVEDAEITPQGSL